MRTSVRQWCLPLFSGYPIGSRLSSDQPARLRRLVLTMRGPRPVGSSTQWTQACDLPAAI